VFRLMPRPWSFGDDTLSAEEVKKIFTYHM